MTLTTDEKNRCVKLSGRLDAVSSSELDLALSAFAADGRDVILDLSECPYLSSAGIRILLKAKKRLQPVHAELFLAGVRSEVLHVLKIAGLQDLLRFEPSAAAAMETIKNRAGKPAGKSSIAAAGLNLAWHPAGVEAIGGRLCLSPEILSYKELGFAIGFASHSDTGASGNECTEFFTSVGHCSAFIPPDPHAEADFRIVADPVNTGLLVGEAISFGHRPTGMLTLENPEKLSFVRLLEALREAGREVLPENPVILLILAGQDNQSSFLTVALILNDSLKKMAVSRGMDHFIRHLELMEGENPVSGITFRLSSLEIPTDQRSIVEVARQHLTFENILSVELMDADLSPENPVIWLFGTNDLTDGRAGHLTIETKSGLVFESYKNFLTRLLYADSSRLIIDPLHGGYSAQTFHVTSYDHEGRKMRPTVLKIGHRDLIKRESERCKQYALPYIFNNSAVVLGAEYYGESGALRYNFVGIGGESSRLKWLTHYYQDSDFAFLEPLFDKVFLHILKPWYGQPVNKTIFPFRDHDPTFTFFPHIYKTAEELLSAGPGQQFIQIPEAENPILNPYWFLKHEFSRRRDHPLEYFTGICHGDLNMQNILLDENMNVYLIDFSETKPRSIISDFARLEAIFLVDNAPLENDEDMAGYLKFITLFYGTNRLDDIPEIRYHGRHTGKVIKNAMLTLKMRKYAVESVRGNPDPVPYYLALLEWVLPIVCYTSLPLLNKRLSMIISSILCEKLMT